MTFTVLGATGFIGRHLAEHLRRQGHEVLTPGREGADWPAGSLGHVIYCIGVTADFRGRPFATVDAHVGRLREILDGGDFRSLVYLSSTRVYKHGRRSDEDASLLLRPEDPDDLYNASKAMGEALCLNCGRPGTKVVRLSNVYGPDVGSENFLSSLLRDAVSKGRLVLRSAPESAKDYIGVEDVVAMLPRIAEQGTARLYNLASGRNTTHRELTDALARITGCGVAYEPGSPRIEFPPIAIDRVRREFSFSPAHVIDRLESLVRQYRAEMGAP